MPEPQEPTYRRRGGPRSTYEAPAEPKPKRRVSPVAPAERPTPSRRAVTRGGRVIECEIAEAAAHWDERLWT